MDRLKTGTPARVDSRTVNLASLEAQPGDADVRWFSFDSSVGSLTPHSTCECPWRCNIGACSAKFCWQRRALQTPCCNLAHLTIVTP